MSGDPSSREGLPALGLPPRQDLLRLLQVSDGDSLTWAQQLTVLRQLFSPGLCERLGLYALPEGFLLSVVVPVYNEESTVAQVIERIRATGVPCEIILVDDGSTDGTREILQQHRGVPGIKLARHAKNQGKGAALRSGFALVEGDAIIVQDADLEYDPNDYMLLLQPLVEDRADVVYGSRFLSADRSVPAFWHQSINRLVTMLSNMSTNLKLTDVETCYKVFRRELVEEIAPGLQETGFGIELEITAKLARRGKVRFHERPVRYTPRSYAEGKKIHWRDGLRALWCILRY